jgi:hypothetical protein
MIRPAAASENKFRGELAHPGWCWLECATLHRNPVKRGLVLEPEHWEWSSYRGYAYGEVGIVKINEWPAAVMKAQRVA